MYALLKHKLVVPGLLLNKCIDVDPYCFPADGMESSDKAFTHIWEQQRGKIRALEDKYRWKLNENGVRLP